MSIQCCSLHRPVEAGLARLAAEGRVAVGDEVTDDRRVLVHGVLLAVRVDDGANGAQACCVIRMNV